MSANLICPEGLSVTTKNSKIASGLRFDPRACHIRSWIYTIAIRFFVLNRGKKVANERRGREGTDKIGKEKAGVTNERRNTEGTDDI